MYHKKQIQRTLCILSFCLLLTGCGKSDTKENAVVTAVTDTIADTAAQSAAEKTKAADDTALSGAAKYLITEEAAADMKLPNQPISSYWFPDELLAFDYKADPDLSFNVSTIPLAKRVDPKLLQTVNSTQSKEMKVVAISIMNASTSGNPSQGTNAFDANTFSYWQYIDKLVYWGGSASEGLIVPPSADVTNAAHKNGVPVLGTVFFPPASFGGKLEWLDTFLQKNEEGRFPMADKLILVADTYGFDGWFINQETEGSDETPLTPEHAVLMQEFIRTLKTAAPDLEIMWYDSMTGDGAIDWQNALTDKNKMFLTDDEEHPVADSMFLNFWWTNDNYADQKLLQASAEKAAALNLDPMELYAGIDVQAEGFLTPVRWDLLEKAAGEYHTSLGLYCPSWTYFSALGTDEFELQEKSFWVNNTGDPSAEREASAGWKGISTYAVEKTVVNAYPFVTNFSTGNGYSFFLAGEKISLMDWNDRSLSDVMPTYRYSMEHEGGNQLSASIDYANAWYGGSSLKLRGNAEAGKASLLHLYSSQLTLQDHTLFSIAAKSSAPLPLNLVLQFTDKTTEVISGDQSAHQDWTVIRYDVSAHTGKIIEKISLQILPGSTESDLEFWLGNLTIREDTSPSLSAVTDLTAEEPAFDEDQMYAGVRLHWTEHTEGSYRYEIYRVNGDNTKTFLGATVSTNFFVNALPRQDKVLTTSFEVVGVNIATEHGTASTASIQWPNNSLPQAKFMASATIAAPGEPITFTSLSSANTKSLAWEFPGGDKETSTDAAPVIVYEKEGVYPVTLTAANDEGEQKKEVPGYVIITEKAADGLLNLSSGKNAEASSYVNEKEAPAFALDGKTETKWCATGTPPHTITIDLSENKTVSQVNIAHAEAGGENADMNTLSYSIEVSSDNVTFTEVCTVTKNAAGETLDAFPPVSARYVRLQVKKPTQGTDTAARIYEVTVLGLNDVLPDAAVLDGSK